MNSYLSRIVLITLSLYTATCFIVPLANATHSRPAPLKSLMGYANYVFVGEALESNRTILGYYKSKIKLITKLKGTPPPSIVVKYGELWFQPQANVPRLKSGEKYLFFVRKEDSKLWLMGPGPKYYLVEKNGKVLCGDETILLEMCLEKGRELISTIKE